MDETCLLLGIRGDMCIWIWGRIDILILTWMKR